MNWNFSIDGTPGTLGNNFVVALYDPSNPSSFPASPVFQQAITTGFPGPFSVTATGLQAIVYNFYLFDTPGTTPGGTVRNQFSLQPTIQTLQVRASLYLITDSSPGLSSSSPTYTDPTSSLATWSYDFEQIGYGTLNPGIGNDYTIDPTTHNPTLLAGNPYTGQKFVIHFIPIVSNQPISVTAPSIVSSYRLITATTTLTNSDMGKLIAIQGASTAITVTLPSVGSFADNESIFLLSSGGVHKNVIIQAAGSDVFQWLQYSNQTTAQTQMILGQSEQMLLIKAGGVWNVAQVSDGVKMVGEIVYDYNLFPINTIQADGVPRNRADYPRLWNYIQKLNGSAIASEGAGVGGWAQVTSVDGVNYSLNNGKFTYGDGSTTFRVPLLGATGGSAQTGFLRLIDGVNRTVGSGQADGYSDHVHDSLIGEFPGSPNGNNVSRTVGRYNGTQVSPSDLSGHPGYWTSGTSFFLSAKATFENRPSNIGVYGLIRI
jgi:hypothetical protein